MSSSGLRHTSSVWNNYLPIGEAFTWLLDIAPGRSGSVYPRWLKDGTDGFARRIEPAALDPFRGYANAIRDELSDESRSWTRSTSSASA